jgi:hypothetical protein
MPKALHTPLHTRNTVTHPINEGDAANFRPVVRPPGQRAVLVNERRAVFDAEAIKEADQPDTVSVIATAKGEWDHCGFTRWTPDLVHHRLVIVGETIARLPSGSRGDFVSLLGSAALAELSVDKPRKSPPTPADISRAEWTWDQVAVRPATHRVILTGMMFDLGARKIAKTLGRMGSVATKLSHTAVCTWYTQECQRFARVWQSGRALDGATGISRVLGPLAMLDIPTVERYRAEIAKAEK